MKVKDIIRIFLPLMLICAIIAGIVAGIQVLTASKIAENDAAVAKKLEEQKLASIAEIYGDGKVFTLDESIPETVDEIRRAESGEVCVTLTCDGYQKKSIQLFVAFDADGKVLRVQVLSSKETTGIGTKVNDPTYLSQFDGKVGTVAIGENGIDKIAGATLSSKAVVNGINTAYAAGFGD